MNTEKNIDEIKRLFCDEKVNELIEDCKVDTIYAFGKKLSHPFDPNDEITINLMVEGELMGILEFASFRREIPFLLHCMDTEVYTAKTLINLAKDGYVSQRFCDNAIQNPHLIFTNKPNAKSAK